MHIVRPSSSLACFYSAALAWNWSAVDMLVWQASPSLALAGFLLLSLIHFAIDGEWGSDRVRRWAIASVLIAAPAIFHNGEIVTLFCALGVDGRFATALAGLLRVAGISALAAVFATQPARVSGPVPRTVEMLATVALVIAPPLVGFTIGFFALHAYSQTIVRQEKLELSGLATYLIKTLPVLVGAAIVLFAIILYAPPSAIGVKTLFVAISALAVPHMLVTPFWMTLSPSLPYARSARPLPVRSLTQIAHRATLK